MSPDNPPPVLIIPVSKELSDETAHELHAFLKDFLSSFEREYAGQIRRYQKEHLETAAAYFLDEGDLPF